MFRYMFGKELVKTKKISFTFFGCTILTGAMQCPAILLVFIIVTSRVSHQSCPAPKGNGREFQILPFDGFMVTHDPLAREHVGSDLDCGVGCGRTEGCVTFTVLSSQRDAPGECRMYDQRPNPSMSWQNISGARSYSVKEPANCDNGYSLACDHCLRFVNTSANFTQAMDICQGLDQGHMVIAKTLEELECVASFVKNMNGTTDPILHLGADDLAKNGTFVWHDNTTMPWDSPLWLHNVSSALEGLECVCLVLPSSRARFCECQVDLPVVLCQKEPAC